MQRFLAISLCFQLRLFAGLVTCALVTVACSAAAEAERKEREDKADFHYKLAAGYFESKNIDLAIRELVTALEIDPDHADAHYLYGFIQFGRKQFEEAADNFKRALAARPNYYAARNHLGVTYLELERWGDAVAMLEPLLKEPNYTTQYLTYNNLGWAYFKMGDLRLADKNLKLAVFLAPKFCNGYRNLGLVALAEHDVTGALEQMTEATTRCPNFAELHMQRAEALLAAGKLGEADAEFAKCAELGGETMLGRRCKARTRQGGGGGDGRQVGGF
jgi:Tfp pilus assembly protein PilF